MAGPRAGGRPETAADDGWNEAWANQYRGADDPLFAEALSFLDESTRQQARAAARGGGAARPRAAPGAGAGAASGAACQWC